MYVNIFYIKEIYNTEILGLCNLCQALLLKTWDEPL